MHFNSYGGTFCRRPLLTNQNVLVMKLVVLLLTVACLQLRAAGYAQQITLKEKNVSMEKVFEQIYKQTGYQFVYTYDLLQHAKKVSIDAVNTPLEKVLETCFKDQPFTYILADRSIIVTRKNPPDDPAIAPAPVPITGRVTDSLGTPLEGVTIKVKKGRRAVVTDAHGNYSIAAQGDAVLVISYIGYKAEQIPVDGRKRIDIILHVSVTGLNEIVVIGYGAQKAANVTGAISTVKMDDVLGDRPVSTVSELMQDVVPGVKVSIGSGQPGSSTSWNIRGGTDLNTSGNSINAGGPLILVDGAPFNGALNRLDPNDVQTVTVLKDAGSAAIYGGRSAFGVILITTKRGKKNQKPQFNYSNNITFASATNLPVKASPQQFLQSLEDMGTTTWVYGQNVATWMQLYDSIKDPASQFPHGVDYVGSTAYPLVGTNMVTNLLGSSVPQIQNNFSVSGGSDKTTYRLAFGNTNENGIMDPSAHQDYFKRYNVSSALSSDVAQWLTTQLDANYVRFTNSTPSNTNQIYADAEEFPPLAPTSDSIATTNGVVGINGTAKNMVSNGSPNVSNNSDIRLAGRAILKPFRGLTVTGEYTYDNLQNNQENYNKIVTVVPPTTFIFTPFGSGIYKLSGESTIYKSLNLYGNYARSFGDHNFTFMAGYNQEENVDRSFSTSRNGMIAPDQPSISTGTGPLTSTDGYSAYALKGYFGRITYDYRGKYLAQVNSRYDGSSNFPPGHRFGFFPSGSLGWRISNENFMSSLKPVLSDLKVRASYGSVGNQNIDPYSYIPTISSSQPYWLDGTSAYLTSLSTPGIISSSFTWEKVETLDYGVDFGILSERLTGSFDWYRRDTKDILASGATPLPATLGTGAPLENTASLRASGYEIQLNYSDHIGHNVRYHIAVNLSGNSAVVTKFGGNPTNLLSTYYAGQRVGSIWGYTTKGFYTENDFVKGSLKSNLTGGTLNPGVPKFQGENPNPGDIMFKDYNGDGIINPGQGTLDNSGDERIIGNDNPQYVFGIHGGISYKNLSFSFAMSGVGKQQLAMINQLTFPNYTEYGPIYANELNYWTPTRTNAYFGRIYDQAKGNQDFNTETQTRFLQNGAYLRINNLTLDYALPVNLIKRIHIQSFHIFCSLEDPFLFDYLPKGLEPGLANQDYGLEYPYLRKTSFGVNVTF